MTNHTADEFRTARFAEHPPTGQTACRVAEATGGSAWTTEYGGDMTDHDMATGGWSPVHEHDQTAEETIADLRDLVQMKDDTLDLQRETAKDLRRMIAERDDRIRVLTGEVHEALQTVSLDVLRTAWENAEVPTDNAPVRAGDEMITRIGGGYLVRKVGAELDGWVPGDAPTRVRKRAPQREPWAELDDAIASSGVADGISAEDLAVKLHEQGWRKTGGEES